MNDVLILIGLFPGILLTVLAYYLIDRRFRPSIPPVIVYFIIGIVISFIAYFIEKNIAAFSSGSNTVGQAMKEAFILVALPEELTKIIFFTIGLWLLKKWNIKPTHIIIFGISISLGFASLENVLYSYRFGVSTSIIRFFTAVPAHAFFGLVIGVGGSLIFFRLSRLRIFVLVLLTI